jgi:hypothetical protein
VRVTSQMMVSLFLVSMRVLAVETEDATAGKRAVCQIYVLLPDYDKEFQSLQDDLRIHTKEHIQRKMIFDMLSSRCNGNATSVKTLMEFQQFLDGNEKALIRFNDRVRAYGSLNKN